MIYTVIGVWLNEKPVVVGVIAGEHEVYGGDEETFDEGLWVTCVDVDDVNEAEDLAETAMIDNNG